MHKYVKEVAKQKNLPEDLVEKVFKSQFEFVKDCMEEGELQSVHLHFLGKFAVKPYRKIELEEKYARRDSNPE